MVLLVCWAGVCLAGYHDDDGYGGGYEDSREYGYEKEQYKSKYILLFIIDCRCMAFNRPNSALALALKWC